MDEWIGIEIRMEAAPRSGEERGASAVRAERGGSECIGPAQVDVGNIRQRAAGAAGGAQLKVALRRGIPDPRRRSAACVVPLEGSAQGRRRVGRRREAKAGVSEAKGKA
ncbi:hypothetical protein B0H14DRAFT_3134021 [Mycena olivaceomarginata]|nr:hypothetical protein B0H14DRAFT_3134021 [Mycena olivaceomarginata]